MQKILHVDLDGKGKPDCSTVKPQISIQRATLDFNISSRLDLFHRFWSHMEESEGEMCDFSSLKSK